MLGWDGALQGALRPMVVVEMPKKLPGRGIAAARVPRKALSGRVPVVVGALELAVELGRSRRGRTAAAAGAGKAAYLRRGSSGIMGSRTHSLKIPDVCRRQWAVRRR